MLKKRVIPVVILRYGEVVQSVQFKHTNIIHHNPNFAIEYFSKWDADEIALIDVSRDENQRQKFLDAVDRISKTCLVPLCVGGWIHSCDDINQFLQLGADKVIINTEAYNRPEFIEEASRVFGSQCIVVSIDCKKDDAGEYKVFVNRGKDITGLDPVSWAKEMEKRGAGEIFLTSIDHDGMRNGYDIELMKKVTEAVSIPVIIFGGASTAEHLAAGVLECHGEAMAAANMFHYVENSMRKAKKALADLGVTVRL